MADPTEAPPQDAQDSLLDALGALREQRAIETRTDMALPGYGGRLWATFRLPEHASKATQVSALIIADNRNALSESLNLIAGCTVGLYLADAGAEKPVHDDNGTLAHGFAHLPGGTDDAPVNFNDSRLERVRDGALCPPRPQGREHSPDSRVRAFFGSDSLVIQTAMLICGWLAGGDDQPGALADLSDRFRDGDQRE
jgi:hypothetical protein